MSDGASPDLSAARADRPSAFARLPWLLTLEAILLVALCYPLTIKGAWLDAIAGTWFDSNGIWGWLGPEQVESFISAKHNPLVIKGALAAVCALGAVAAFVAGRLAAPQPASPPLPRSASSARLAFLVWPAFVIWCIVTVRWSPAAAVSREGACWLAVFAAFGFFHLRRGVSPRAARQLAVFLLALGAPIALISIAQATGIGGGLIGNFISRMPDPRNWYGSLLGHNTTVGSFTMMTLFPAVALIFTARGWPARLALGAYLALAMLAMLVTQSRAVWLIAPALMAAFAWTIVRRSGVKFRPAHALALVSLGLAVAASQLIDRPWNPFFVKDNPVARRLEDFSVASLRQETRLRILLASAPLVAERPMRGWGLHSFRAKYPEAQADYLAAHPDSGLGLTVFRTERAHDDYLQLVIETGAIGLLLALVMMGELFARGWAIHRRLEGGPRLLHAAFGFSTLALCLHGLVDFPFHVPQLVVPWIVCAAAWAAWRDEPPAALAPAPAPDDQPEPAFRPATVLRLSGAGVVLFLVPLAAFPFVRAYQADLNFSFGISVQNALDTAGLSMDPPTRDFYVTKAGDHLGAAVAAKPYHDQAWLELADLYFFQARLAQQSAPPGMPAAAAPLVNQWLRRAAGAIARSRETLTYHETWYKLAQIDWLRWSSAPNDQKGPPGEDMRRNLEKTLYFAPSFTPAMYLLAGYLRLAAAPDRARIDGLLARIRLHDPILFLEKYQVPVHAQFEAMDYEGVIPQAEQFLRVDPAEPAFHRLLVDALMWSGQYDRALAASRRFQAIDYPEGAYPAHPSYASYARLDEALIGAMREPESPEAWSAVLDQVHHSGVELPRARAEMTLLEQFARERIGPGAPPARLGEGSPGSGAADWSRYLAERRGAVLHRLLGRPGEALEAFEARLAMDGPAPTIDFWIAYGYLARERGDAARLAQAVESIRRAAPRHPVLARGRLISPSPPPGEGRSAH